MPNHFHSQQVDLGPDRAPWRSDPHLIPLFQPNHPDTVPVRFVGRSHIEVLWVTITDIVRLGSGISEYCGTLRSEPQHFESLHLGDDVTAPRIRRPTRLDGRGFGE